MNIGLIDVDSHHYPNFALMRLSAWHKVHGDNVEWADAMFGSDYDRVYKSKIFTFSPDDNTPQSCVYLLNNNPFIDCLLLFRHFNADEFNTERLFKRF